MLQFKTKKINTYKTIPTIKPIPLFLPKDEYMPKNKKPLAPIPPCKFLLATLTPLNAGNILRRLINKKIPAQKKNSSGF